MWGGVLSRLALIDSGAEDNLLDTELAQQLCWGIKELESPILALALNGREFTKITQKCSPDSDLSAPYKWNKPGTVSLVSIYYIVFNRLCLLYLLVVFLFFLNWVAQPQFCCYYLYCDGNKGYATLFQFGVRYQCLRTKGALLKMFLLTSNDP